MRRCALNLQEKIISTIAPSLEAKGYEVVQVRLMKNGRKQVVSIDIDKLDNTPVSIDDCAEANRLISMLLDVEDFIKESYNLEVGSPGEIRPLTKISDFERFCGRSAKVELHSPVDGLYKFFGELTGVKRDADQVAVCMKTDPDQVELELPYENIKKASIKRVF